ncbi:MULTISPECIES: cellulose biosynthesis cyclic di-GMP-binding regulatory protein BcsB [Bacillus]|uniref:Cellulose biosynthesis cyclic di-GMP-binding regulatory protein BcsB n=1 Tax=Bacillus pumilus TaxID=1408 RepID=A0AAE3WNV5_BACPU|nr:MULTISPECIES: cellulose biosynthesis cyclic di-GMP-binding regulatory protein BcsB [Bacillus]MDR4251443.1 cellulose biosynthesis cyclic di-GMP-binding regulatory protein BcsB [Bacillus pumilus]PAC80956.1 regulator [Bacillus sp. 7788]PRS39413.1 regulator [Bacillus sp. NMCC46]QNP16858.1 cellulose biosynthesis cyclic di-GMP-binding regulatory protein BcsB [Bacillus pumilus]
MKSVKWMIFILALSLAIQPFFMASQAMAQSNRVQVKDDWVRSSKGSQTETQHLSEDVVTLYGQEDRTEFSYQMEKEKVESSTLTLNIEASPLLISPSSFTVMIDGEIEKTIPVSGKNQKKSIQIKLNKAQLKKGSHQIQLAFYGVLKEGVCINQETPANWLKVYPESELAFKGAQTKDVTLDSFPSPFIPSGEQKEQTDIVIPNTPEAAELEAAMKIYRTLKNKDRLADLKLVQEKDLKQIAHPTIAVGAKGSWKGRMKSIEQAAGIKTESNQLTLAVRTLTAKKKEQPILFVSAKQPKTIAEKISVLTQPELTGQLTGTDLLLQKVTANASKPSHHIRLIDFGGDDVTVGTKKTASDHYYYPKALIAQQKSGAKLNLSFKKSDPANKAERLTVMINNEPHDIPLTKLGNKDENGFYHVSIPVDSQVLQKNEYVDLQFVTTGFKSMESCRHTDEEGWIYIDKNSSLQIPEGTNSDTPDLAAWPLPYTSKTQQGNTLIIMPDQIKQATINQMAMLTESFSQPEAAQYHLIKASNVTNEQLKKNSLIFIGGIQTFSLLKEKADDLIVPAKKGQYDVSSFGMINETTARIVWTQPSVWNKEQTMTVFAGMTAADADVSNDMIRFLQTNTETATVAIESKNKEMFSNHQTVTSTTNDLKKGEKQGDGESWIYFACIAVLIIFVVMMIVYFVRKNRKKTE